MSEQEKREFELTEYELLEEEEAVAETEEQTEEGDTTGEHHHHHHHRHHSKAYYKFRRKKHKIKKVFKKHKYLLPILCIVLGTALAVTVIVSVNLQKEKNNTSAIVTENVSNQDANNDNYVSVVFPSYHEPLLLVDKLVTDYVNDSSVPILCDMISGYDETVRLDAEQRVTLSFKIPNRGGNSLTEATVEVADNAQFNDAQIYDVTNSGGSAELKFLLPETVYYYRFSVELSNGQHITSDGSFETAASPRILSLDGVRNCRDIGGWRTNDGKKIKYGLLYRGTEIDGANDKGMKITDLGVAEAHQYLGIVSDFDLRGLTVDNIAADSAFGATTKHYVFDAYEYVAVLKPFSSDYVQKLFSLLADSENYPVYMHCSLGHDRTGTACYLLEALLGVSDEDLIRDYELSVLYFRTLNPRELDGDFLAFMQELSKVSGSTTQQKTENYLLSCGVTEQQIQQIKDIFLE